MTEFVQVTIILVIYRCITVLVGLAIVYWGYRLFCVGVYEKAGDLKAAWGEGHLTLKQATPGTFFALFGAVVIAFSIWRGIHVETTRERPSESTAVEPSYQLPVETQTILEKLVAAGIISDEERQALGRWLEEIEVYAVEPGLPLEWEMQIQ